jgi:hypothetical protein
MERIRKVSQIELPANAAAYVLLIALAALGLVAALAQFS